MQLPWLKRQPERKYYILRTPYFYLIQFLNITLASVYYINFFLLESHWQWFWHLAIFELTHDIFGSLLFIPIILATVFFWLRGILITWIISMLLIMPVIIKFSPDINSIINNIFYMIIPVLIVGYISLEFKWREKEKRGLSEREREKHFYLSRLLKAQDDARQHIAQELHDDTTQTLLVVATRVQILISEEPCQPEYKLNTQLEWIRDKILEISNDVRKISLELRPSILDDMELVPALEKLIDDLKQNESIRAEINILGSERRFPRDIQTTIFRVIQEALNNVRRHAKATKVSVILCFNPDNIKITVKDNGQGFNVENIINSLAQSRKLGIIGMQDRVGLLNGTFNIQSGIGKGTTISITLKYDFFEYSIQGKTDNQLIVYS